MTNENFLNFLINAECNEKFCYDPEVYGPCQDVIDQIYEDVSKFKYYTLDGRLQDILIKLVKDKKYYKEGYGAFVKDIETELKKLIVPNIIMLPINFLDINLIKNDIDICENIKLFLPDKNDLRDYTKYQLLKRQEHHNRDKKHKNCSNLCYYFENNLKNRLDKEHIRLTKDYNFFNYPVITIKINNIDKRVEGESGRIVEAIYCFIRILDFIKKQDYKISGYIFNREKKNPAHTYVVYYNGSSKYQYEENALYGYSFRCNFANILDVDTNVFLSSINQFGNILQLYLKTCFLDLRCVNKEKLNHINLWKNSIKLFNTAFEFASTEKYDACVLILCSLLESLFLKNEGRGKKKRLLEKLKEYKNKEYYSEDLEAAVESIYNYRNDIVHEGIGYENKFLNSRRLNDYQGIYPGMKPFEYFGAVFPHKDINKIKIVMEFIARLIIDKDTLDRIDKECD